MTLDNNYLFNDDILNVPFGGGYNIPLSPVSKMFVSLDGIQSGVPTLTTSTLTPTTLRNIEQTFIELTSDPAVSSPYQAGFVPPPAPFVNFIDNSNDNNSMGATSDSGSQSSWHTPSMHEDNNSMATDTSSLGNSIHINGGSPGINLQLNGSTASSTTLVVTSRRKNTGGRRPTKSSNLTPEEEEKRKVRRERNKLAAARCRKRRVDQTNELQEKVDKLEKEKEALQREIEHFNALKDELKFSLEAHRSHCRQHHHNSSAATTLLPSSNSILMNVGGNNNNNNNNVNQQQQRCISPIDIKPIILKTEFDNKLIKNEPIDDSLDGPPSPKRIMLSSTIPLQLPNVSTISTTIANAQQMLNTPTITTSPPPSSLTIPTTSNGTTIFFSTSNNINRNHQQQFSIAKTRPSSLNVPLTLKPSQALNINKIVNNELGVPITTPSTGTFNFDSLMDGGTGLTPVSGPLMPTCSTHISKHPLELTTPTSEPSKLVSL